jgi:hypothetical protein
MPNQHVTVLPTSAKEANPAVTYHCAAAHTRILVRHSSFCSKPCQGLAGHCRKGNGSSACSKRATYVMLG